MKNVPLREVGEFGLIEAIKKRTASSRDPHEVVGIGDDAFVGKLSKDHLMVTTKDLLVENIHFKRAWCTPEELGHKAMAVNLSDLASMGKCRPLFGFIGLAVPGDITVDYVDKLYTGMNNLSKRYGLRIVGGDTVSTKKDIVISITLTGEIRREYLLTRSGARVGDIICATGTLGDSGGGLHVLMKGMDHRSSWANYLVKKHLLPVPRFDAAWPLAQTKKLNSMIDSSDGLAASVRFISEMSGLGAHVDLERLPLSPELKALAAKDRSVDPVQMALNGGEDYELVFTVPPQHLKALQKRVPGITPVGVMTKGRGVRYYRDGKEQRITGTGFQHFHE